VRWAGHPQSTAPLHVALAPRLQAYTTQQREQSAAEDPVPRTRRPEENLALVAYVAHTDTPFSTKSGRTVTDDNMICNQVSRQKKKPKEREREREREREMQPMTDAQFTSPRVATLAWAAGPFLVVVPAHKRKPRSDQEHLHQSAYRDGGSHTKGMQHRIHTA
jgi:hypothetical protein